MADKQGELFPEDKKPKSTKKKRRKSLNLPLKEREKIKKQREQQAESNTKLDEFNESEREYWKRKNEEDSSNLKIMSPEMQETYKNNPGYPKFNEGTEKVMQGTKRGSKERLKGLQENIGNYGRIAGRTALAIKPDLPTTLGIALPFLSLLINNPTRRLGGAM